MAIEILMPRGGDAMTEGKVLKWRKHVGERVSAGELVLEVETDKVDLEVEAEGEGVLRRILVPEGETVEVGRLLGVIAGEEEEIEFVTTSRPGRDLEPHPPVVGHAVPYPDHGVQPEAGRIFATPVARKMAREQQVDLASVAGTGPGGRIRLQDVSACVEQRSGDDYHDEPLTAMRKTIATRMAQSLGPVPHFYLTIEVDMGRAAALRQSNRSLSYTEILIKASAGALSRHPRVNASFLGDRIRVFSRVHIGIAVALEGGGLITPVLRDCDRKPLARISSEAKGLAERARNRKLSPEEFAGATFSISNLGMLGIEEFSAITNPPEAAILAVGAAIEKPVVNRGRIEIGRRSRMTLSCDHRVLDGAEGAEFLRTLKKILEGDDGDLYA